METITIELTIEKIKKGLESAVDEIFKSSYSNPIKDIVSKSLKDQEGKIKEIVDSIIVEAISNPEFKTKLSDIVIQRMVESALTAKK